MLNKSYRTKVEDIDEQKGIVKIAISKFDNIDSYGDIVRKGAFTKTFKESGHRLRHVLDHELKQSSVVGVPLEMMETDTHAVIVSAINLEKQIGRDLFSDYKFFAQHGINPEHSFMYEPIKYEVLKDGNNKMTGLEIKEVKMYEYSTVARGANEHTPLIELKSFINEGRSEEDIIEFVKDTKINISFVKSLLLAFEKGEKPLKDTSKELNIKSLIKNL